MEILISQQNELAQPVLFCFVYSLQMVLVTRVKIYYYIYRYKSFYCFCLLDGFMFNWPKEKKKKW